MSIQITESEEILKPLLWFSLLLNPLAAGTNTVLGYTLSHQACYSSNLIPTLILCIFDGLLCLFGGLLAWKLRARLMRSAKEEIAKQPLIFLANLSLLFSALCLLVILGGALATLTLRSCF